MPICTYLSDNEFEHYSSVFDRDVNELLQEVRLKSSRWYIKEYEHYKRSWLGRLSVTRTYSIYNRIDNSQEVQVMNFYGGGESSLCTNVSKPIIMAYLYGLLANQ